MSPPRSTSTLAELVCARRRWTEQGATVVWTNGCFDLFHAGHVLFLEEARSLGDILIVGLNSDPSVRALKGAHRPFLDFHSRATILLGMRAVDHAVMLRDHTPCHEIEVLRPDICCKDDDYAHKRLPERSVVEAYGGRMRLLSRRPHWSTTALADRVMSAGPGSAG